MPTSEPPPRRSDPTRARILHAARRRFAERGYEGTTIRAVAADAEIDPSLVMRYYGSKDGLFAAAADVDLRLPDLSAIPRRTWGRRIVRHFFDRWYASGDQTLALLLRAAASNEHAVRRLRSIVETQIATALRGGGADQPERRASLVASQMLGVAYSREILGISPIAAEPPEELIRIIGPTIQRYTTATL
jgi:AcrR family transcriptional regulator